MGVEGGLGSGVGTPSIGGGISVGEVGTGISGVARVGADFNPAEFTPIANIGLVVNEGPVALRFLENNMSHKIGSFLPEIGSFLPAGEINFIPQGLKEAMDIAADTWEATKPTNISVQSEPNTVLEAGNIAAAAWEATKPAEFPMWSYNSTPDVEVDQVAADGEVSQVPVPEAFSNPVPVSVENQAAIEALRQELRLAAAGSVSPQVKLGAEQSSAVTSPVPEANARLTEIEEQLVKNAVKEEEEDLETRENEEVQQLKWVAVEAEEVSTKRVKKIVKAGEKASAEVEKEAKENGMEAAGIDGRRVKEHLFFGEEDISPTRRGKGPDGTLEPTSGEVESGFYKSINALKKAAIGIVARNRPAMWAKEGKTLKNEEFAKVENLHIFKFKVKTQILVTLVKKRVEEIKRRGNVPVSVKVVETNSQGSRIEDTALAEVFKVVS